MRWGVAWASAGGGGVSALGCAKGSDPQHLVPRRHRCRSGRARQPIRPGNPDHHGEKPLAGGELQRVPEALADWKEQMECYMPPYMIPSELFAVDALPQTISNKVDRKQLELRYQTLARTLRMTEKPA